MTCEWIGVEAGGMRDLILYMSNLRFRFHDFLKYFFLLILLHFFLLRPAHLVLL